MLKFNDLLKTKTALPIFAGLGFIIMMLIIKLQPDLEHNPADRPSTAVSYIELQSTQLKP